MGDYSSGNGDVFYGQSYGDSSGGYGSGGGSGNGGGSGIATGGIVMSAFNLFDPNAKRYKKARWSNMRNNAQLRINNIARQQAAFTDESARNTEELKQDMYSRGLGNSSIGTENEAYYERVKERTNAGLADEMQNAENNRRMVNAQINYERKSGYVQLIDSIVQTAASML